MLLQYKLNAIYVIGVDAGLLYKLMGIKELIRCGKSLILKY